VYAAALQLAAADGTNSAGDGEARVSLLQALPTWLLHLPIDICELAAAVDALAVLPPAADEAKCGDGGGTRGRGVPDGSDGDGL
jgi:hypothetical protein